MSVQPFASALSQPTVSMQQSLEQRRRLQQAPSSSLDVFTSAQEDLLTADECELRSAR